MTAMLSRNQTRITVDIPGRELDDIERAVARAVRTAIGDPKAKVRFGASSEDEDEYDIIIVRQEQGAWWAPLPSEIAELISESRERYTLTWREGERPKVPLSA